MKNLAVLFVVSALMVLASCGGAAPAPKPSTSPATLPATTVNAKALYEANCAVCHGPKRQGIANLAPPLTPTSLAQLGDEKVMYAILKGRPGTAMTGFEGRLSEAEINALVRLLKDTAP